MAEVIANTGVKRESGYLYFLRGSDIWRTPMKRAGGPSVAGKAERVHAGDFKREDGYLYFIDKGGNVARAKRAVGGQKRRATKSASTSAGKTATAKAKTAKAKKAAPTKKSATKKSAAPKKPAQAKKPAKRK